MHTINTILSRSDQILLESTLLRFGRIISFAQLYTVMDDIVHVDRANARQRIARLADKGWLIRLRNGLYLIVTDMSTLGTSDLSEYIIAQALRKESYISLENALQYHGMFDQSLTTVRSITTAYTRNHKVQEVDYVFSRVKEDMYFGFTEEVIDKSYQVNIAEAEKALLDMLYLRDSGHTISVVIEKLRNYQHRLDISKLQHYAQRYGIGMVRTVGFILELIDVNTSTLLSYTKNYSRGYTKLTKDSSRFNAKWRLYYDDHLIA